jgi:hypothetical protein
MSTEARITDTDSAIANMSPTFPITPRRVYGVTAQPLDQLDM